MIINQTYLFIIFIINGMLIGLLFDFFRILRKAIKTNDFVTYIEDILFWILTGGILLFSIFTFNNGEIRLFLFLGIFVGILLYMITLSSYIIKINLIIINFLKKIIYKIIKFIMIPFKYLIILIKRIFLKPITFIFINIKDNSTNLAKKLKFFRTKSKTLDKKEGIRNIM